MPEPADSEASASAPALPNSASATAKVLGSRTFAGSARLTGFLRFVCEETLAGRADQLNETTIGQRVFGRAAHFNPAEDSIVRSSGRLLRQRLERYYKEEGAADPVRVVVPRGSYVPVFVDQTSRQSARADGSASLEPVHSESRDIAPDPVPPTPRRRWLAVGAAAGLLAGAGIGWRALARPARASDVVSAMWDTLLVPDRDLLIVPADSGLVMWQAEHHQRVALADYTGGRAASEPEGSGAWSQVQGRRYTGVVALRLAIEVTRRAGLAATRVRMRFARDLRLNELKEANAVLIGAGNANPWAQLFEPQCAFAIDLDADERFVVSNRAPRAGELERYVHVATAADSPGYAQIALKRNVGGSGHVLLVGGTGSAGTEAGIDFLLDPVTLPRTLQRINPTGAAWEGFEILLRARFQGHNSVGHDVLASRFWPRA